MKDYDQVTVSAYRLLDAWHVSVRYRVTEDDFTPVWLNHGSYVIPASGTGVDKCLLAVSEALYNAV